MNFSFGFSKTAAGFALALMLSGCAGLSGVDEEALMPRLAGNEEALKDISAHERSHLQLIATNLVATLVQIPEMRAVTSTLQFNKPQSAYGNAIVRALEDAGFGLQMVSADQGQHFVSYSKSLSETESGTITNYSLAVGKIQLARQYAVDGNSVFPSSLLKISGTDYIADIALADNIFTEQGGDDKVFISGTQRLGVPDPELKASSVDVRLHDQVPRDKRTTQESVFNEARQRYFRNDTQRLKPDLNQYIKHRRTVLIFDDNVTQMMGNANKRAVRLLVREFSDDDIMVIKACLDADGEDDASMNRAIRVEEELAGYGVPTEAAYIAPCSRASYRHASDNSPTPVELVHYRPR